MENQINLKKVRSISDNLDVTFSLLKLLIRPLFFLNLKTGFLLVWGAGLINAILFPELVSNLYNPEVNTIPRSIISGLIYLPGTFLIYLVTIGVFLVYFRKGTTDIQLKDVFEEINLWGGSFFVLKLVFFLIAAVGSVLLIIPGIFLATRLYFTPYLAALDERDGDELKKSWSLTNDRFWNILGYLILVFIIFYIISFIFSLPTLLVTVGFTLFNVQDIMTADSTIVYMTDFIFGPFKSVGSWFLGFAVMVYLVSLREAKEATSLQERIKNLNSTTEPMA